MTKRIISGAMSASKAAILTAGLAAVLAALILAAAPAQAAFPGANGKVFFQTTRDGFAGVYSMNPDGSGQTGLVGTDDRNAEQNPAVSPDGSRIAYEYASGIWVMGADGDTPRKLAAPAAGTYGDPAWSPDGTRIAFTWANGDYEILLMNADGTGRRNLTNTPDNQEFDPAWSPDGTEIAYTRTGCENPNQGGSCVYKTNADGSGTPANLTPRVGENDELCERRPGSGHWGKSREPSWSPDGQKIAFTGPVDCAEGTTSGREIWTMSAPDGSGKTNLTSDNRTDQTPAFSPDGQSLVFASDRDGDFEIYAIPATGGNTTQLTNNTARDENPDWGTPPPPDTTAPTVGAVSPASGARGISAKTNVTAIFSEAMKADTLNGTTVRLVKKGATKPVAATIEYDPAKEKVTLNPTRNLVSGATYTATIMTGAKDAAGNALSSNKTWRFKVK